MSHALSLIDRLFHRRPEEAQDSRIPQYRLRAIEGSSSAGLAADMLCSPTALGQLSHDEALAVVAYMQPRRIQRGTLIIREGDTVHNDFMLLVLDGEVTVESMVSGRAEPITVTVLGPGSIVGELGLVDGAPRSASCTAISEVRAAVLTRSALEQLLGADPRTAAKLMMAVAVRISERMREGQEKLKLYAQLTQVMKEEISDLMPL
jgi:CRP-like cAMP-binding protein